MAANRARLTFRSEHTDTTVTIVADGTGDEYVQSITVELSTPTVSGAFGAVTSCGDGIVAWLQRISDHWRGWEGSRDWRSLEGHVCALATHDGRGHISLAFTARDQSYKAPPAPRSAWSMTVVVVLDVGQLDRLIAEAKGLVAAL